MTRPPANDNKGDETAACPICGRPCVHERRPFCSRRCADVDLHRWLTATYVIAGREPAEEDEITDGQAVLRRPNGSGAKN